ncbi:glycerophosphodiester phosphodiesterase family protein [Paenibacillus allorhizosphaerae]|uniref:GP-PDE domain-containing protein n=1 Tax=Paenibacillus allorhizosphaerae TaxID=2849866 RepID=A0ABM8VG91_9BACL|nr:glycerophosphodiester phosphodiesterase family protein [Paenibacillus allorhizosphaerae]CAG7637608.1 hypothetical protein PAECIP111802_02375 [Paenibacillus allorhizosphaerae]
MSTTGNNDIHPQGIDQTFALFARSTKHVLVAAHRGVWIAAPENSISAIRAAIDAGAHIVEIDLHRTKDGELVLMHDPTVDRMTNGQGKIAELTLNEIKSLRLKNGSGGADTPLTDETVPTLREAMEIAKDRIMVNVDKCWKFKDDVWAIIEETGTTAQTIFKGTAGHEEVARWLASKSPRPVYMHIVLDKNIGGLDDIMTTVKPDAYELVFATMDDQAISDATIAKIKQTGARMWINMMFKQFAGGLTDDPTCWDWCIERGATMLQTDFSADMLRKYAHAHVDMKA